MKPVLLGIIALSLSGCAFGISAWRSLADLEQQADLIVVGQVVDGTMTSQLATFSLSVDRVVKGGDQFEGRALSVSWPAQQSGLLGGVPVPLSKVRGIWFLTNGPGGWVLLPVTQGDVSFDRAFIPISATQVFPPYAYQQTDTATTKLAAEISSAIENSSKADEPFLESLMTVLDTLPASALRPLYERMATASLPARRALGFSGLVKSGDPSSFIELNKSDAILPDLSRNTVFLNALRNNVRSPDPAVVAWLGRVATSSDTDLEALRRAAAHALSAIHTAETLPHLGKLLESKDPQLRVEAIGGMASFAVGLPIQTLANTPSMANLQPAANASYRTPETTAHFALGDYTIMRDEAKYLDFWKNWWAQNQAKIATPTPAQQ